MAKPSVMATKVENRIVAIQQQLAEMQVKYNELVYELKVLEDLKKEEGDKEEK